MSVTYIEFNITVATSGHGAAVQCPEGPAKKFCWPSVMNVVVAEALERHPGHANTTFFPAWGEGRASVETLQEIHQWDYISVTAHFRFSAFPLEGASSVEVFDVEFFSACFWLKRPDR